MDNILIVLGVVSFLVIIGAGIWKKGKKKSEKDPAHDIYPLF